MIRDHIDTRGLHNQGRRRIQRTVYRGRARWIGTVQDKAIMYRVYLQVENFQKWISHDNVDTMDVCLIGKKRNCPGVDQAPLDYHGEFEFHENPMGATFHALAVDHGKMDLKVGFSQARGLYQSFSEYQGNLGSRVH